MIFATVHWYRYDRALPAINKQNTLSISALKNKKKKKNIHKTFFYPGILNIFIEPIAKIQPE